MSAERRRAIDAWIQRPGEAFMAMPWLATLNRWTGSRGGPSEITAEQVLASMDEAAVERALLCAWWGPQGELISNEGVTELVGRHPDRFAGVASVNLFQPMEAVRTLRRFVREHGFKALRIVPWLWNLPPNDRRYYPLYAECVELGVPFCTQVGHTGPLCPSEPGRPIPYLDEVLLDFPELVVVGGHVGYPWMDEILSLATKYENFYLDTSAYVAHRYPPELVEFMKGRGRHRVLFGSNYPMVTPARCLERLDELGLDDEAERLFLYGNAARVFDL